MRFWLQPESTTSCEVNTMKTLYFIVAAYWLFGGCAVNNQVPITALPDSDDFIRLSVSDLRPAEEDVIEALVRYQLEHSMPKDIRRQTNGEAKPPILKVNSE